MSSRFILLFFMSIVSDLEKFYDSESKKYYQTRKKYRADSKIILNTLESSVTINNPIILDLGCGGGRCATLLKEQYKKSFSYTGVDISGKLLGYAKKDNPTFSFVHADMNKYLIDLSQESVDVVIACSSFQHIPDEKSRISILKNIFRVLKYDGVLILVNRSFSEWFLKTYWKSLVFSTLKSFFSLGKTTRRDVMIPRSSKGGKQYRYYHLFSLDELQRLTELSGLTVKDLFYLNKDGNVIKDWKNASNSFLAAKKTIHK